MSPAAKNKMNVSNLAGAVQTLIRIISAYGDNLSPEAWLVSIKSVIFELLSSVERELRLVSIAEGYDKERDDWKETAIVVIQGVSGLFATYLNLLTAHQAFASVWKKLLDHFATMLDFQVLDVNAATFGAVRDILRRSDGEKSTLTPETTNLAWGLWSRGIPVPKDADQNLSGDNQKCLLVWVETLLELYRLIEQDLTDERVDRMLALLREAMEQATPGTYASDIEYVTPLQGRILEVFRMVRTDISGVPSAMIMQVAEFVSLAFTQYQSSQTSPKKRTYVAMSKESMTILQSLILRNAADLDIYESGAFSAALTSLGKAITLKYGFAFVTKSTPPWKQATTSFLSILEVALPHLRITDIPRSRLQDIWHIAVSIAIGIISADCHAAKSGTDILADQDFDMASFRKLHELIIPSLGAEAIPDRTRKTYAEGLFRTSIIHEPAPAEMQAIYGGTGGTGDAAGGLAALYKQRPGRTIDPPPTQRSKMSYACLEELFALVAVHDEGAAAPMILVQPPTPRLPRGSGAFSSEELPDKSSSDGARDLYVRLARTAAPYMILRSALSVRAYIADQPLRGRMPQPLSQRTELGRVLDLLVALRSEPAAIPDMANVESESRKHLLRLYPLLVGAMRVAGSSGDDKVLRKVGEALEVVGGELGL